VQVDPNGGQADSAPAPAASSPSPSASGDGSQGLPQDNSSKPTAEPLGGQQSQQVTTGKLAGKAQAPVDAAKKAKDAAEKKAKDVVDRARKGEKFPELARDTSDAESAKNFGQIGWFKKADLNPNLQRLFQEKRGYLTDVMKTENGFVIFKMEERHEEGLAPFEEVENEVTEKLYATRMQPKAREFLTKLREQAFLEIRDGYIDSGAAPGKDTGWKDPAQLKPETTTKEEVAARKRKRLLGIIPRKSAPAKPASDTDPAKASTVPAPAPTPAGQGSPTQP